MDLFPASPAGICGQGLGSDKHHASGSVKSYPQAVSLYEADANFWSFILLAGWSETVSGAWAGTLGQEA